MPAGKQLLRRLAAADEASLNAVLARRQLDEPALDRATRALVQLSALLAVDASTSSLRWAVDLAGANGADDEAVVHVLLTALAAAGTAQATTSAPRLALALDLDVETD